MTTLSAIPIKIPWIDNILAGTKTWEIRTKNTKKIGPVALIRSGSETVVATAILSEVVELTASLARANARRMGMSAAEAAACVGCYAWVLEDIVRLKKPVPYKHPCGAITWVTLDEPTTKQVYAEAKRSRPKCDLWGHGTIDMAHAITKPISRLTTSSTGRGRKWG